MSKFYKCSVNMKSLRYYLNNKPDEIIFEAYDRQELILLSYAILNEYKLLKFKNKYIDTSDN